MLKAVERQLAGGRDSAFSPRSTVAEGAQGWLLMFESLVERGVRSPSTLDLYRDVVERHVISGIGRLRLGEVTTSRMNRFLQDVLRRKGYARPRSLGRFYPASASGWSARTAYWRIPFVT